MAVKFLMPHTLGSLYEVDEVAGFDKEIEADLVKRKIAEAVKATKAAEDEDSSRNTAAEAAAKAKAKADKAAAERLSADEAAAPGSA